MTVETGWRFFDVTPTGTIRSRRGHLEWPAPTGGAPGAWVRQEGPIVICVSGLHASPTIYDAFACHQGHVLGRVEAQEVVDRVKDKWVAREMRILALYPQKHLIACAFLAAAKALPVFEAARPFDRRPRVALEKVLYYLRSGCSIDMEAASQAARHSSERADDDASTTTYHAAVAAYYASSAAVYYDAVSSAAVYYDAASYVALDATAAVIEATYAVDTQWFNVLAFAALELPATELADLCEAAWMSEAKGDKP